MYAWYVSGDNTIPCQISHWTRLLKHKQVSDLRWACDVSTLPQLALHERLGQAIKLAVLLRAALPKPLHADLQSPQVTLACAFSNGPATTA